MCGGKTKTPSAPPVEPAPAPAQSVDAEMQSARNTQEQRAQAAGGMKSTIATSGLGDLSQADVRKSKLGA